MQIEPNEITPTPEGDINCYFKCPFCPNGSRVTITKDEYRRRFHEQMSIQRAMPDRSATIREIFTSALCEECQKAVFGE